MKNITITPVMTWQLTLSSVGCAISAPNAAPKSDFATPFAAVGVVATDAKAIKRERALAGMGHRGNSVVYVPGFLAWSPPI